MTLVEILPSARKLSSIEKLQLIRILAEEVELGTDSLGKNSSEEETEFWLQASQVSLDSVWNNDEDDVYAQLL
ncbi:MAG: hypothetical protein HC860_14030 [Alkalinema sp. RU_4_3]|nr:hypothetical protein [Alkalinema sp. RU_4_3]